jgi:hypothetical protein
MSKIATYYSIRDHLLRFKTLSLNLSDKKWNNKYLIITKNDRLGVSFKMVYGFNIKVSLDNQKKCTDRTFRSHLYNTVQYLFELLDTNTA